MEAKRTIERSDGKTIQRIKDFTEEVTGLTDRPEWKEPKKLWYRGLSNATKHKLIPSAGRPQRYGDRQVTSFSLEQEILLVHRFRRRAYPLVDRIQSDWEALLLGRHHGLPTRLLDWTANPLAALYFACSKHRDHGGVVWAIHSCRTPRGQHELDVLDLAGATGEEANPFTMFDTCDWKCTCEGSESCDAIKIMHPFYNSPRIVAQDGIFTLHSNPEKALEDYAGAYFCERRLDIDHLHRWRVSKASKGKLLRQLERLGVNRRTLFPDLEGIAESLWRSEVLWRGKKAQDCRDDTWRCPCAEET